MSNNMVEQLAARRVALQAEQADQRAMLAALRGRLTELEATRAQALRRYDVGVDDAATEAATALDEILVTEAAIAKADRYMTEYPARIEALNAEIERAGYRDRCKTLLSLQSQEREAWAKVAATMPEFFAAWHEFSQIATERTVTARSLANYSGAHGLTAPVDRQLQAPDARDIAFWLELRPAAAAQVQAAIEKAAAR